MSPFPHIGNPHTCQVTKRNDDGSYDVTCSACDFTKRFWPEQERSRLIVAGDPDALHNFWVDPDEDLPGMTGYIDKSEFGTSDKQGRAIKDINPGDDVWLTFDGFLNNLFGGDQ